MRGKFHAGCNEGIWFYHAKDGVILVNDKNKDKIKEDMNELLNRMPDEEIEIPLTNISGNPKKLYKKAIDGL